MRDINLFHAKHDWFTLPPEMTGNRGIVTVRIDESLHFTNIRQVKELFQKIELRGMHPLYAIILDCSNVPDVDANALQILIEVIEQWKKKSVIVCFVKIRPIINSAFIRSGLMEEIGYDHIFQRKQEALSFVLGCLNTAPELYQKLSLS